MNILLGSCGGLTGIYLAKQYREHHITGIDSNEKSAGRFFVNDFFAAPKISHENYIDKVIEIIENAKIDVYIPTHSQEISIASKNKNTIEKNLKGKLVICDVQTINLFEDKLNAYTTAGSKNIKCPKIIYSEADITQFPLLLKPKVSSGGRNIIKLNTIDEYRLYSSYADFFICEYYDWKEYSVDCFFSGQSKLIGYYVRERIKNIGGAVSITETALDIDITEEMAILEKEFNFIGPVNFQFFCKNGEKIFFDFNLRFASGGLPLTVHSGFNIPDILLKESMEMPYDKDIYPDLSKKTMYRYFEEIFE